MSVYYSLWAPTAEVTNFGHKFSSDISPMSKPCKRHGCSKEGQLQYKGHRIRVALYPDENNKTFHAIYFIYQGVEEVVTGTTEGGFRTIVEAEDRAKDAACRWIDQRRSIG